MAIGERIRFFRNLRHTYAAEKYRKLVEGGTGALDAHFAVSKPLGHERSDVTDIYLASLRKKGAISTILWRTSRGAACGGSDADS